MGCTGGAQTRSFPPVFLRFALLQNAARCPAVPGDGHKVHGHGKADPPCPNLQPPRAALGHVASLQALPPAPFWSPGGDTNLSNPDPTPVPICCRQPEGEAPRWCRAELVILRALMKFSHFPPIPIATLICGHLPLSPCPGGWDPQGSSSLLPAGCRALFSYPGKLPPKQPRKKRGRSCLLSRGSHILRAQVPALLDTLQPTPLSTPRWPPPALPSAPRIRQLPSPASPAY